MSRKAAFKRVFTMKKFLFKAWFKNNNKKKTGLSDDQTDHKAGLILISLSCSTVCLLGDLYFLSHAALHSWAENAATLFLNARNL